MFELMKNMFSRCSSLLSLNINNFDTSKVTNMNRMFYHCSSLISLDLRNFNTKSDLSYSDIFKNINPNLTYCISHNKTDKFSSDFIGVEDCDNLCFVNSQHKIIKDSKICAESCYYNNRQYYDYNNICFYDNCPIDTYNLSYICEKSYTVFGTTTYYQDIPDRYYLKNDYFKIIDVCNMKCNNCTKESEKQNLCISCNINNSFYPKYNDSNSINFIFIDCYPDDTIFDGFFIDKSDNIYKPCYKTCKSCNESGSVSEHKCMTCYSNYTLDNNNCIPICEYYYYLDDNNEIKCTSNNSCIEGYNKLISDKNQCIDSCESDGEYKLEYNNIFYKECPSEKN